MEAWFRVILQHLRWQWMLIYTWRFGAPTSLGPANMGKAHICWSHTQNNNNSRLDLDKVIGGYSKITIILANSVTYHS